MNTAKNENGHPWLGLIFSTLLLILVILFINGSKSGEKTVF